MRTLKNKNIDIQEHPMCISKLESDIKTLLLRYESGTNLKNIRLGEFDEIVQLIENIIRTPENHLIEE